MGAGIVKQSFGSHAEILLLNVVQHHMLAELGILGVGAVLSVTRSQLILGIGNLTLVVIVTDIRRNVVIESIGFQFDILINKSHRIYVIAVESGKFIGTVIVKLISIYKQGVALLHPHISESVQRA